MKAGVDQIVEEMTYGPNGSGLYSTTGCKRVGPKVDILLEEVIELESANS